LISPWERYKTRKIDTRNFNEISSLIETAEARREDEIRGKHVQLTTMTEKEPDLNW